MRLVKRIVDTILKALTGRAPHDPEEIVRECEAAVGLSVDVALAMQRTALLKLLSPGGSLDHQRTLLLGLAMVQKAILLRREQHIKRAEGTLSEGKSLIIMALKGKPELIDGSIQEVLKHLRAQT